MALMENILCKVDAKNIVGKLDINRQGLLIRCPNCGRYYTIDNIEDYVDSDLRNPSDEYFVCPECYTCQSLIREGVNIEGDMYKYRLYSDGTMLYVKDEEGKFWELV